MKLPETGASAVLGGARHWRLLVHDVTLCPTATYGALIRTLPVPVSICVQPRGSGERSVARSSVAIEFDDAWSGSIERRSPAFPCTF